MGYFHSFACPANRQLILKRLTAAVLLSLLFMVVYSSCNWLTSLRGDVQTFYFDWEKKIPLIPLFIIPYMSIDVFFVIAPFLCRDRDELGLLSHRIVVAIIVAGLFFLLMPLQFGFPRPVPDGWSGPIFKFLHGFDQPYNLFPSLHITLRTILAEIYARKSRGFVNLLVNIWFSLIGFSTIFTYQHHIIDIVGGFILALFIFYFIREKKEPVLKTLNPRIGVYYGILCLAAIFLAIMIKLWGVIFYWPAVSMLLISWAYLRSGPAIFKKCKGVIPLSAKIIFAPYLIGQEVYLRSYYGKCNRWDELLPYLWIGRKLNKRDAENAVASGVTAVIDLTAEFSEAQPFRSVNYLNLQTLDLTAPPPAYISHAVDFINKHAAEGIVYLHCKIGYSRTAVVAAAYLLASGIATNPDEALRMIREKRPSLIVRPEARQAIEEYYLSEKIKELTPFHDMDF